MHRLYTAYLLRRTRRETRRIIREARRGGVDVMDDDRTFRDGARYSFKDTGGALHPGLTVVTNETGRPEYTYGERGFRDLNDQACGND